MLSASPNGTVTGVAPRPVAIMAGSPRCPRCGYEVPGTWPREGWHLGVCLIKRHGHRCGQGMVVLATSGVTFVIALTREELETARAGHRRAPELLADLQALGTALMRSP